MNQTSPPSAAVIGAFGGEPGDLEPLAGGQGGSWRAGPVVLKRAGADSAAPWLGPVLLNVPEQPGFRLARPLAARDGTWVAEGWEATAWLAGRHQQRRWPEALAVSGALHRAFAAAVPARPPRANRAGNAWGTGDRVAWGEEEPGPLPRPVAAVLDRLAPLLAKPAAAARPSSSTATSAWGTSCSPTRPGSRPPCSTSPPTGGPPPTPRRCWSRTRSPSRALRSRWPPRSCASRDQAAQALARAVVFRVVTAARNWESIPGRVLAELEAYGGVLALLAA